MSKKSKRAMAVPRPDIVKRQKWRHQPRPVVVVVRFAGALVATIVLAIASVVALHELYQAMGGN